MGKIKRVLITAGSIVLIAFICLRVAGEFRSCAGPGKEYVYNETVTLAYLTYNPRFEDTYKRFGENSTYLTAYEYEQVCAGKEFPPKNRLKNDIVFLKGVFTQAQADLAAQRPSPEAGAFHKMLDKYYGTVLTDYLGALQAYSELDTDDAARKEELRNRVMSVYDHICDIQTEMFRVQIEYGKRVGLEVHEKNQESQI